MEGIQSINSNKHQLSSVHKILDLSCFKHWGYCKILRGMLYNISKINSPVNVPVVRSADSYIYRYIEQLFSSEIHLVSRLFRQCSSKSDSSNLNGYLWNLSQYYSYNYGNLIKPNWNYDNSYLSHIHNKYTACTHTLTTTHKQIELNLITSTIVTIKLPLKRNWLSTHS